MISTSPPHSRMIGYVFQTRVPEPRFSVRRQKQVFAVNLVSPDAECDRPNAGSAGFDMFGVDLTHHGEDCTFETMLKRFGLGDDPGLRSLAEIVHDIDLKDRKFTRKEASGLDAVVTGLALFLKNDQRLAQQATGLFDGLYALLGRRAEKKKEKGLAPAAQRPPGRRGARNQRKSGT